MTNHDRYKQQFEDLGITMTDFIIKYFDHTGKKVYELVCPSPYEPTVDTIKNAAISVGFNYKTYTITT